jgi:non-ribosomal peptide synthetase component F
VVLGSPVANRQRPELEGLIGFFVNTVVLRVRLHGDPTFRELLRRCRKTTISCLAHQDMPLDRLVELINPVRVAGRNPLFQVNFRMQGIAPPPPQLAGLRVTRMTTETGASRFELAFGLVDQPDAVRGYLEYSFSLFRRATIEAWQGAFVDLLVRVVDEPDIRISQLAPRVLADIERRRESLATTNAPSGRGIRRRG